MPLLPGGPARPQTLSIVSPSCPTLPADVRLPVVCYPFRISPFEDHSFRLASSPSARPAVGVLLTSFCKLSICLKSSGEGPAGACFGPLEPHPCSCQEPNNARAKSRREEAIMAMSGSNESNSGYQECPRQQWAGAAGAAMSIFWRFSRHDRVTQFTSPQATN